MGWLDQAGGEGCGCDEEGESEGDDLPVAGEPPVSGLILRDKNEFQAKMQPEAYFTIGHRLMGCKNI